MIKIIANSDEENIWIESIEVGENGSNRGEGAVIAAAVYELFRKDEDFEDFIRAARKIAKKKMEEEYK